MLVDEKITKIIGGGYGIAEVKHMEKTLWKKEPLTYVLTTLGDERYFTERPDLVEKYPKGTEGKRVFVVKRPNFVENKMELWINDNREDFIQYYMNTQSYFLKMSKNGTTATGGIMEVPFNSILGNGEGCFMRTRLGEKTIDGNFGFEVLCISCDKDKVDTVKIAMINYWQKDLKDEELQKHKKIQEKVAMYFIGENPN